MEEIDKGGLDDLVGQVAGPLFGTTQKVSFYWFVKGWSREG